VATTTVPAGIVVRGVATLLDMVVFLSLSVLIVLPLVRAIDWSVALQSYPTFVAAVTHHEWLSRALGACGLWVGLWWAYFVVSWGMVGASPGKAVLGLRVIDYRGRCPIGIGRAVLRLAAYMVSSMTLGIGHSLIAMRGDCKALHDLLAGTHVVRLCRGSNRVEPS